MAAEYFDWKGIVNGVVGGIGGGLIAAMFFALTSKDPDPGIFSVAAASFALFLIGLLVLYYFDARRRRREATLAPTGCSECKRRVPLWFIDDASGRCKRCDDIIAAGPRMTLGDRLPGTDLVVPRVEPNPLIPLRYPSLDETEEAYKKVGEREPVQKTAEPAKA